MSPAEEAALAAILASKNYRDVCPDAVRRVFAEALSRHPRLPDADKAARAKLHQMTGAFMTPAQLKLARKCMAEYVAGDLSALGRALSLHASTRERANADELYGRVFALSGTPGFAVDLACGLNPLILGARGLRAAGCDVSAGAAMLVDDWARACGWPVACIARDLLGDYAPPRSDMALLMKLLPVLERQRAGAGLDLLSRANAKWRLVTFPTKTLGGRGVGMEKTYSEWLEGNVPEGLTIIERFAAKDELCYLLKEKD